MCAMNKAMWNHQEMSLEEKMSVCQILFDDKHSLVYKCNLYYIGIDMHALFFFHLIKIVSGQFVY